MMCHVPGLIIVRSCFNESREDKKYPIQVFSGALVEFRKLPFVTVFLHYILQSLIETCTFPKAFNQVLFAFRYNSVNNA